MTARVRFYGGPHDGKVVSWPTPLPPTIYLPTPRPAPSLDDVRLEQLGPPALAVAYRRRWLTTIGHAGDPEPYHLA